MTRSEFTANAGLHHAATVNTQTRDARYVSACTAFAGAAARQQARKTRQAGRVFALQCITALMVAAPGVGILTMRLFSV